MQGYIVEDIDSSQAFLFNIDCEGDVNLNLKTKEGKSLPTSKYASRSKRSSTNASPTFFNFPLLAIEGPSFNFPETSYRAGDGFSHTLTPQEKNKSSIFKSLVDVSLIGSPGTTTPPLPKKKSIEEGEIVESNFLISSSEESNVVRTNKRLRDAQGLEKRNCLNDQVFDDNQIQEQTVIDTSSSSDSIIIDSIFLNKTKKTTPPLPLCLHASITSLEKEILLTASPCSTTKTKKRKNLVGHSQNCETNLAKNSNFFLQEKNFVKCTEKEEVEESFLTKDTSKETNQKVTENLTPEIQNTKEAYILSRNCKRIKRSLSCSEKQNNLENSTSECVSSDSDISDTDKKIFKRVFSNSVKMLNCVEIDQECAWKVWTLQNNLHERFPLCLKRVAEPKMSSRPLRSVRYTTSSNIVEVSPSFWVFSKRKVGMKEYNFFISLEELSKQRTMMNHPLTNTSKHSNSLYCRKCGAIQSQRNEYHDCPRIRCNNCGRMGHKKSSCNERENKSCIPQYIKNYFDEYDESLRFMMVSHRRKYGHKISCIICHAGDHACCKKIN